MAPYFVGVAAFPMRQVITDCIEVMHEGYHADAIITLGGCDKHCPWVNLTSFFSADLFEANILPRESTVLNIFIPRSVPAAVMPLARKEPRLTETLNINEFSPEIDFSFCGYFDDFSSPWIFPLPGLAGLVTIRWTSIVVGSDFHQR